MGRKATLYYEVLTTDAGGFDEPGCVEVEIINDSATGITVKMLDPHCVDWTTFIPWTRVRSLWACEDGE